MIAWYETLPDNYTLWFSVEVVKSSAQDHFVGDGWWNDGKEWMWRAVKDEPLVVREIGL